MRSKDKQQAWIIALSVMVLIALVLYMLHEVSSLQGNARVVNYAGIVRGATQRLVKRELYGFPNDSEIVRLDEILEGLQNGGGDHTLTRIDDPAFQRKLGKLREQWGRLKTAIGQTRSDSTQRDTLFRLSESYFNLADETVSAAENYSDGAAARLNVIEGAIIITILIVALLFISRTLDELRQNRRLKNIAYIDSNTGLPNKRSCEEKLNSGGIVPEDSTVCCLMFDLNNLKTVNDSMGHKAGDLLISTFASLLRRTAPPNMFVGRFGGDEFIGIINGTSREEMETFIRRLKDAAAAMDGEVEKSGIRISFACGYALSSEQAGSTVKVLMDLADQKMYQDKTETKHGAGKAPSKAPDTTLRQ